MMFNAVTRESLAGLAETESPADAAGFAIPCHNQRVIATAKNLFLANSFLPRGIDPFTIW